MWYTRRRILDSVNIEIGDFDTAFELLHEAIPGGNSYLIFSGQWAIYDPIRSDPRFDELLRELGLDSGA